MKVVEVLRGVRALFTAPDRWTQKKDAKDDIGLACDALSRRAWCWCLAGAVQRVTVQDMPAVAIMVRCPFTNAIQALARAIEPDTHPNDPRALNIVTRWNDTPDRTFAEIVAIVDRAIAAQSKEAA